jgi:[2Fe-2S] binding domain
MTTLDSVGDAAITTIEAVGETPAGRRIQQAWPDLEVVQCGYCRSGQIMAATALLAGNTDPSDSDIDEAMSGNICRCGTYVRIRETIKQAVLRSTPRSPTPPSLPPAMRSAPVPPSSRSSPRPPLSPFHPLFRQSAIVIADQLHDGSRHPTLRSGEGTGGRPARHGGYGACNSGLIGTVSE